MAELTELTSAVAAGKRVDTIRLTQELLAAGHTPQAIVEKGLVPGMAIVGDQFKRNEIFVPEMLIAARAMKEALKLLEPLLVAAGGGARPVRLAGVRLSGVEEGGGQLELFGEAEARRRRLALVRDGLNAARGAGALRHGHQLANPADEA